MVLKNVLIDRPISINPPPEMDKITFISYLMIHNKLSKICAYKNYFQNQVKSK
jgi:hypothetical protein